MKFGVYNAVLHDRSLPEAIEVIAGLGLTGIELNSGGFLPPVTSRLRRHPDLRCGPGRLPRTVRGHRRRDRRTELQRQPAAPRPGDRDEHADDVRRSIRLANRLGQHRVVTMSGLPAVSRAVGGPTGS